MRRLVPAVLAVSAAVTWAGAVASAWPADARMTAGARLAGAGDVAAAGTIRPGGSWGRAVQVPGLGALNKKNAEVESVSCASSGNCAAAGYYVDRSARRQGFVAAERNGAWGRAVEVLGLEALNKQNAEVTSVSCARAGTCAAGGDYGDGHGHMQGFVAVEKNGVWRRAIEVPGLAALNKGKAVVMWSVSCGSPRICAAGGSYEDRRGDDQGFVAVERNGRWGRAVKAPGLAALSNGGSGVVLSVSCTPAGTCVAGGDYSGRRGNSQGFVAAERNGRWGRAVKVPGLAALNKGGEADVDSVSCASAGNCAAGGRYEERRGNLQGFVAAERNGRWGRAVEVPGLAALNVVRDTIGDAEVLSVSCASSGNCAAGGYYTDSKVNSRGFVAAERNGRWGRAVEVPGLGALNKGGDAYVESVSCASAGTCAAAGDYTDQHDDPQGFVVVERNGRWARAVEVPGLGALNVGGVGAVFSVSCAPAGTCSAGGYYTDRHDHSQGFVVSQTG